MTQAAPRPQTYGNYWETEACSADWYRDIFRSRQKAHDAFADWFSGCFRDGQTLDSVIEVGCGRAPFYPYLFAEHHYTGVDISNEVIKWCQENYTVEQARFIAADVIAALPSVTADLVFSHAVIDHVYDIDGFFRSLAGMAKKKVYIAAYYGWFPNATAHETQWDDRDTCYYNKLSPSLVRRTLEGMGCRDIQIYPVRVDNDVNKLLWETAIVFTPPAAE